MPKAGSGNGLAPLRIGTLVLGVRDLERSLAFYGNTLGLAVQFSPGELAFLDAGGVTLVLFRHADLKDSSDERRAEVVFHVEDIDAAHREMCGRGVAFRVEPRVVTGDRLAADFRDPDGHVLSILGPRRTGALS